jgi:hypothetical protein
MDKMLEMASGKLGITAEELKGLVEKGDMDSIMSKMNSSDADKFKDALSDPNVAQKLKDSPEMAEYLKKTKKPK